jgi:hypothetical protein
MLNRVEAVQCISFAKYSITVTYSLIIFNRVANYLEKSLISSKSNAILEIDL